MQLLEQMLRDVSQQPVVPRPVGKGSLINFTYLYAKIGHPVSPVVLVTDVMPMYIRGINIRYLTPIYIQRLLDQRLVNGCNNPRFSYFNVKNDAFIVGAFRQYKRSGVANLKQFDCKFLSDVIGVLRNRDVGEVQRMSQEIRRQLAQVTNPVAQAAAEQPI